MKFLIFTLLFASISAQAANRYLCQVSVGNLKSGGQDVSTFVTTTFDDMKEVKITGNWVFMNRSQIHANPGALEFIVKNKKTYEQLSVKGNEEESVTSMRASTICQ